MARVGIMKYLQYNARWRVPAHCGVTNLVRSGTKQPQSFPVSAADQARQLSLSCALLRLSVPIS